MNRKTIEIIKEANSQTKHPVLHYKM